MARPWPFAPLEPGSYGAIVADPPWRFRTWSETNQTKAASRHYRLMPTEKIAALPVGELAAKDCMLFLWACAPMLPQALRVMEAWGFAFVSELAWRKTTPKGRPRMGLGYWARSLHEPVLIGKRGSPRALRLPSLFDGVAREHSRKPDEFYALISARTEGRRCDLFAREARLGFDCWGDELGKFARSSSEAVAQKKTRRTAA